MVIITLDVFLFQYMWRINIDVYLSSARLKNVICFRKNPEWCWSDSWGRYDGRVSLWYNQRYLWCCMFWFIYYTMYVEDFIELYASRWGAQMCLWTQTVLHVVAGTWTMLLYPLLLLVEAARLIWNVIKNKSYCRLYQVEGMLSVKVYMHALLIFLGKTVNIHPHVFG